MNLTDEEKGILESVENGEWHSVSDAQQNADLYESYAEATFRKDRRINIGISERDLIRLQRLAIEEGMPYQTLISSILHKYVSGRIVERFT